MTVVVEFTIAIIFHIRKAGYLATIITMNVFTQILLNFIVNTVHLEQTGSIYTLYYLGLEALVTIIEALVYLRIFKNDINKNKIITYAIVANVSTFLLGLLIPM